MNKSNATPNDEEVMLAFSVEPTIAPLRFSATLRTIHISQANSST